MVFAKRDLLETKRKFSHVPWVQITDKLFVVVLKERPSCTMLWLNLNTPKPVTSIKIGSVKLDIHHSQHSPRQCNHTLLQLDGTDGSKFGTVTSPSDSNSRHTNHKFLLLPLTHQVNTLPPEERIRNYTFGMLQTWRSQPLNMMLEVSLTQLLSTHNKTGLLLPLKMESEFGKFHQKTRLKLVNQSSLLTTPLKLLD